MALPFKAPVTAPVEATGKAPVKAPGTSSKRANTAMRNHDAAPLWSEGIAMRLPLIPKLEIECKYLRQWI